MHSGAAEHTSRVSVGLFRNSSAILRRDIELCSICTNNSTFYQLFRCLDFVNIILYLYVDLKTTKPENEFGF